MEIENCIWCNNTMAECHVSWQYSREEEVWVMWLRCTNCGARTGESDEHITLEAARQEAVSTWNRVAKAATKGI